MSITFRPAVRGAVAALGTAAVVLVAACGDAPEEEASGDSSAPEAEFNACMVTDSGGVDDQSFNQSAYAGLEQAEGELGVEVTLLESAAETDFAPNIEQLVDQDCGLIVTVGFLLAGATGDAATANADERFALVDSTPSDADGNPVELDNVKPILFDTAQAAYLAGYLAAGMTQSGTVATYGGINIPSVTVFMDGFVDGVAKHNEDKGTSVKVLGWDKAAQDGTFAGGFTDVAQGQTIAENFISQGADIILPVAGPVGGGSAAAAQNADGVSIIWVDQDGYQSTNFGDVILTSVLKNIDSAVYDVTEASVNDEFEAAPYVGTLENEGVGLAPYHDFEDQVPAELTSEIDALREQIISGELVIESVSSPSVS